VSGNKEYVFGYWFFLGFLMKGQWHTSAVRPPWWEHGGGIQLASHKMMDVP